MYGLGKSRSKLGKFLDCNKLSQSWLEKQAGLTRNTVTHICSGDYDKGFSIRTRQKVISVLRKHGYDVMVSDFWES